MNYVKSKSDVLFNIINYTVFAVLSVIMVYPIWHQLCLSLSDSNLAKTGGFFFMPRGFDTAGYEVVLTSRYIWTAFFNSAFVTIVSVILTLFVCCGFAYLVSKKEIPGSKFLMYMVLFAFLFSGGMIPTYLVVNATGLVDSLWALIIPTLFAPYNIIIIKNFFKNLPPSLEESALIDGAGYFTIFFKLVIPLSKPVIATISIWVAVSQWNSYMGGLLYLNDKANYILPLLIRDIVMGSSDLASIEVSARTNSDIVNAATIIIATIPIMIVYPFLQKYFTKGIMLGAVKG